MAERIGFLGPRDHGPPDGGEPRARGHSRCVAWNRTRERAEELAAEFDNVTVADSAAEAAAAGIAISMVPDVPEVEAVLLGAGRRGRRPARAAAWRSTCPRSRPPPAARSASGWRSAASRSSTRPSPARGPRPRTARSRSWPAGPKAAFVRAQPAFEAMGELVLHVGPQGHGSMIKLINNTLAADQRGRAGRGDRAGARRRLDVDEDAPGGGLRLGRVGDARAEVRVDGGRRLRGAVQARAHAQGRALLHRRGAQARAGAGRWRRPPRSATRRPTPPAAAASDFSAVIEAIRRDPPDRRRGPRPPQPRRGQPAAARHATSRSRSSAAWRTTRSRVVRRARGGGGAWATRRCPARAGPLRARRYVPGRARRRPARLLPRRRLRARRPRHPRPALPPAGERRRAASCWRSTTGWRPSTRSPRRPRTRWR